jgi:hypothetical protein
MVAAALWHVSAHAWLDVKSATCHSFESNHVDSSCTKISVEKEMRTNKIGDSPCA